MSIPSALAARLGCVAAAAVSMTIVPATAHAALPKTLPAGYAASTTRVVSPLGNDITGKGTLAAPYRPPNRALAVAKPGDVVLLDSGAYPRLRDTAARVGTVTVQSLPGMRARVAGADLLGARGLRLLDPDFTAGIVASHHPPLTTQQPAQRITVSGSDITTANTTKVSNDACLMIRAGASDISINGNHIHDCSTGIAGVVRDLPSKRVSIVDNELDSFLMDCIQFGSWYDVTIERNIIRDMKDPANYVHTDGIQFVGDARNVRIANNRLSNSTNGQLILIQDQYGPITGVDVENNLLTGASGWAVQSQGATATRFVNNTIVNGALGSLLVRRGPGTGTVPTDTVVANNILERLGWYEGAVPGYQGHNLLKSANILGSGDIVTTDLRLAADFSPLSGSPAIGAANKDLAPTTDEAGVTRPAAPSVGALE